MMLKVHFTIIFITIITYVAAHDMQNVPPRVVCSDEKCKGTLSIARVVTSTKCFGGNLKEISAGKRIEVFAKDVNSEKPFWGVKMENSRCFVDKSFIKELNIISKTSAIVHNPFLPKIQLEKAEDEDDTEADEDAQDETKKDAKATEKQKTDPSITSGTKRKAEEAVESPPTTASPPEKHEEVKEPPKDAPHPEKHEEVKEPPKDVSPSVKTDEVKQEPAKDASPPVKTDEIKQEPAKDASPPVKPEEKQPQKEASPEQTVKVPSSNKSNHDAVRESSNESIKRKHLQTDEQRKESKRPSNTELNDASSDATENTEKRNRETPKEMNDDPKEPNDGDSDKDTEDEDGTDEGSPKSDPDKNQKTSEIEIETSHPTRLKLKVSNTGKPGENNDSPKMVEERDVGSPRATENKGEQPRLSNEGKADTNAGGTTDSHESAKNTVPEDKGDRSTATEDKPRDTKVKEIPKSQEKPSQDKATNSIVSDTGETKLASSDKTIKVESKAPEVDIRVSEKDDDIEKVKTPAHKKVKAKDHVSVSPQPPTAEDRIRKLGINAARRVDDRRPNVKGPKAMEDKLVKPQDSVRKRRGLLGLPKESKDTIEKTENLSKGSVKTDATGKDKSGLSGNDPWLSSSKTELERCFRRISERNFFISSLLHIIDVIRMPARLIIDILPKDTVKPFNDVLWTYLGISLELLVAAILLFIYVLILSLLFQCCLCRRNFKADLMKKSDIVVSLEEKISEQDQLNSKLSDTNIQLIKKIKAIENRVSKEKKSFEDESKLVGLEKKQYEEEILSLNNRINDLSSENLALEERINAIQRDNENRINTEIRNCESRVCEIQSSLSDKDKESERLNAIIVDMTENQTQLVEQANSYYESMTQMQKEVEKMNKDRNSLEQSLLNKDSEITQLRQSFQFLKSVQEHVDSEVNKELSEGKIVVDPSHQPKGNKKKSNSLNEDGDDVASSDEEGEAKDEDDDDDENTEDSTALNEALEARKSEVLQTKLSDFLNISQLRNEMQQQQEYCLSLESKLRVGEESRSEMELRLDELKRENNSLQTNRMEAEERQKVAQNKLDILSQYFKEREAEMQRNMGEQEVLKNRNANQMETHKSRAEILEGEIGDMKKQMEAMEGELRESERSYRKQINELEKRAFDNWKASRTSEREVKELKEENFSLRQRLTEVERSRIPPLPAFPGMPRMPVPTKSNSGPPVSSPINTNPPFPMVPPILPTSMPPMPPPLPFMMPPRPPPGMVPNMGVDAQRPPSRQSLESENSRADAASMGRSFATNSDGRPLSRTSGLVPGGGMGSTMPPPPSSMPFMPPPMGMRMPPPPSFPAMPPPILQRPTIGMPPGRQPHQKSPSTTSSTRPPR